MTRRFRSTKKFDKQFQALNQKTTKQAKKVLETFMKDPSHPSLRFKKVQGTGNFFEISVNKSIRIIVEIYSEANDQINLFYIIGTHEEVFPVN